MTFDQAQQGHNGGIMFAFPSLLIAVFSKTPAVLVLVIVGAIPFLSGLIGWLRNLSRRATP